MAMAPEMIVTTPLEAETPTHMAAVAVRAMILTVQEAVLEAMTRMAQVAVLEEV